MHHYFSIGHVSRLMLNLPLRVINWVMHFNDISNPLGLFYASKLGNPIYCTFILLVSTGIRCTQNRHFYWWLFPTFPKLANQRWGLKTFKIIFNCPQMILLVELSARKTYVFGFNTRQRKPTDKDYQHWILWTTQLLQWRQGF